MTTISLVREARRRAGLSHAELALRAGVPQSTVGRIESGAREPKVTLVERLIRAAGFEPRYVGGCTKQPITAVTGRRRVRKQKRTSRMTSNDLAAAYVLYDRQQMTLAALAELLWEQYGYPSPTACKNALNKGFHAEGFRLRTKSEARMCMSAEKRKEIAQAMREGRDRRKQAA